MLTSTISDSADGMSGTTFTVEPQAVRDIENQFLNSQQAQQGLGSEDTDSKTTNGSALYVGHILHHRHRPVEHRFRYSLFMVLLDLDELETIFRRGWFCSQSHWSPIQFRRSDYFGDANQPLADAIRDRVLQETGRNVDGPIRMLAHLRCFGLAFNPVAFYYCYAVNGQLQAIVADVTNTPWRERYAYVIPVHGGAVQEYCCEKQFHVSPFMPMNQKYRWSVTPPDKQLQISISNHDVEGTIFDAKLALQRQPFSKLRLAGLLARFPWITFKVVAGIYWQALRLWLKGVPYVPHPRS